MRDNHGRIVDNLRISVTQRCNITCPYCHHEGQDSAGEEISLNRIEEMVREAAHYGIKHVKITGGEPLLRPDIVEIVRIIKQTPGIEEVSMTTNGIFLKGKADALKSAGLDRVNIGCDAVEPGVLTKHTRMVKGAIKAALAAGLQPIKLNMVMLKGVNDEDITGMIAFAGAMGVGVQLIELINTEDTYFKEHFLDMHTVEDRLSKDAERIEHREFHNRTRYWIDGVPVEVVAPSRKDFCAGCRRMRITSDGMWKPCLRRKDTHSTFTPATENSSYLEALKRRELYN